MKKFFNFLLLTTMVAGGATLSANAELIYPQGGDETTGVNCEEQVGATCEARFPGSPTNFYLDPAPNQTTPIDIDDYNYSPL